MSAAPAPGRIEAIAERVAELDLVSALRWLDTCFPDAPRPGTALGVADEPLRLSQPVQLGFAGTSLATLAPRDGRARGRHDWRLQCRWLGLFGGNGALPLHYTEYADRRARHHADPTFREFVDLFNHRLLGLFYRASTQFDPSIEADKPDGDRLYAEILGALGGRRPAPAHGRDALDSRFAAFHAGWFGARTRSPDGLEALILDYFGLPCRVQEFVGGWLSLPPESRVTLGRPAGGRRAGTAVALGRSSLIGRRAWSIGHAVVLRLGPLGRDDYLSLRPGGARARSLHDLVRNYLGDETEWSMELELDAATPSAMPLDGRTVLGFTSWLGDRQRARERRPRRIPGRVCGRGPVEAVASRRPPRASCPEPVPSADPRVDPTSFSAHDAAAVPAAEEDPFDALEADGRPGVPDVPIDGSSNAARPDAGHDDAPPPADPFADFPDAFSDDAGELDDAGDTRLQGPRP